MKNPLTEVSNSTQTHFTQTFIPLDKRVFEVFRIKVVQELHLQLQELIFGVMSHSPHLFVDLRKEAGRNESLHDSIRLAI